MGKLAMIVAVVALTLGASAGSAAAAFRCGAHLVEKGQHDFIVKKYCGTPMARENVGYRLAPGGAREYAIERWVYGPRAGHYTVLVFEAGRLVSLESVRR